MRNRVVPMIHVQDVKATADWYQGIGFEVNETYGQDGEGLSFAILSFGDSEVMLNSGGQPSSARRREVDLYVYASEVDALYARLKDRVEIVAVPHDTFYGMRELIIRDVNRFWLTFGEPSAFEVLMTGVREGNVEAVRKAVASGRLSPEALTSGLAAAAEGDHKNEEIAETLRAAGANDPVKISDEILRSYVGHYRSQQGMSADISLNGHTLIATPAGQPSSNLVAIDQTTFRPAAFDGISITFKVENGETSGFTFRQGPMEALLTKVAGQN